MNPTEAILLFLRQKIGLDAASIGVKAVEAAILEAMQECGLSRLEDFFLALQQEPRVMTHLVEKLVVPETWFFRDQVPFDVLSSLAKSRLGSGDVMRIASMPCSTGEEPYSIVITMLEAGFEPGTFMVDAVDLSHVSLERARRGFYGPISFRGAKPGFREKYFTRSENGFLINEDIKRCVQFHYGNLLDPLLLKGREGYEVIFCRNVLIYLDAAGREAALGSFKRLLLPGGLLFVGHAETLQIFNRNFRLLPEASSFGYVYVGEAALPPVEQKKTLTTEPIRIRPIFSPLAAKPKAQPQPVRPKVEKPALPNEAREEKKTDSSALTKVELDEIAQLANRGQLEDAQKRCEQFLLKFRTVAQGHFLLGVIRAAKSFHAGAEEAFRRAIYLDPQHQEALVHLALLLERKGDGNGAALARQRAERIGKDKVTA